jgi:hypothetical protein
MWAGQRNVKRDALLSRRHWSSRPHGPPCGSRSGRGSGVRRRAIGPDRAPAFVESCSPAAAIAFHAYGHCGGHAARQRRTPPFPRSKRRSPSSGVGRSLGMWRSRPPRPSSRYRSPAPNKQKHAARVRTSPRIPVAGHAPRSGAKTVPRDSVRYRAGFARAQIEESQRNGPWLGYSDGGQTKVTSGGSPGRHAPRCAARCGALRSAADGSDGARTRDLRRDSAGLTRMNSLQTAR